jgi:demethylmenaquinone methyltransferase/2-methoxy-6-polyprenyl-1,4-benzoquinol methylase
MAISAMFGRIAGFYDLLNHAFSLGIDVLWRKALAGSAQPADAGVMLDLASGTLDVALALTRRHPGRPILAVDFCRPMLERGWRKLERDRPPVMPVCADARHIPVPDASAACVTMAFGIRNIHPRQMAFAEMLRVLRPGGRACILEFGSGRERIWGGIYNLYLSRVMPLAGRLVSGDSGAYRYLAQSIREFPAAEDLAEEMRQTGFARVDWRRLTSGIACLHVGIKGS